MPCSLIGSDSSEDCVAFVFSVKNNTLVQFECEPQSGEVVWMLERRGQPCAGDSVN